MIGKSLKIQTVHKHKEVYNANCSLSLWRVVRESKLVHLDSLIHGLQPKHSLGYQQHLYQAIIIYICITGNHSDIYTQLLCTHSGSQYMWRFPLLFTFLCRFPFAPLSVPFYLLGTLLAATGSVHPVPRLLVNWSLHLHPSPFRNPDPLGFPPDKCAPLLRRHRNTGSQVQHINVKISFLPWDNLTIYMSEPGCWGCQCLHCLCGLYFLFIKKSIGC